MSAIVLKGSAPPVSASQVSRSLSLKSRSWSPTPLPAFPRRWAASQQRRSTHCSQLKSIATTDSSASTTMAPSEIPPATLPGTPKSFPIPAEKLVEKAKQVYKANSGVDDPNLLADDFRFEFPVVSLAKQDYVKAVRSFKLKDAFPNMESHPYDWRVDKYEPQRVWFTIRNTATHTGPLHFAGATYKATGKEVLGAPECMSFVFNEDGKVSSFTGGYVMDRRVGNTGKMGALFGILSAIGAPVPKPGSITFMMGQLFMKVRSIIAGLLGRGKQH